LFDCVLPTRVARTGAIFTRQGRVNVRNAAFREDLGPPDDSCRCAVCARYTRAYLRHLFNADEMLGPRLATYHNLSFLAQLMEEARAATAADRFDSWRREVLAAYVTPWSSVWHGGGCCGRIEKRIFGGGVWGGCSSGSDVTVSGAAD